MDKKVNLAFAEDVKNPRVPKILSWEGSKHDMTEEELNTIKNMNWEWYYNCYIYLDEILPVSCKRCGHINVFQPKQKVRECENCGAETKRCEKEEEL